MTVEEQIKQAEYFHEKGNWDRSLEILDQIKGANDQETMEVLALYAWNYWKKVAKSNAAYYWTMVSNSKKASDVIKASAHAGLGIYYAEKGDKKEALKHSQLAQDLLPENATANQNRNLNACGIMMAKIGELDGAEGIPRKVAQINEQLMNSDDLEIIKEATHQRGKNGYNLASLVYIPQELFVKAHEELYVAVSGYEKVNAETDLAAAYHRLAETNVLLADHGKHMWYKMKNLNSALEDEKKSLELWEKHQEDAPGRVKTAQENIKRIENKMGERE